MWYITFDLQNKYKFLDILDIKNILIDTYRNLLAYFTKDVLKLFDTCIYGNKYEF